MNMNGQLDLIRQRINHLIREWDIAGVAVGIIKNGECVLAEGFGYRDIENRLAVHADTLFSIGSTTKAFTTMAVSLLVEEGKLNWDTPVKHYLRNFRMYDPVATERATLRDLACHRTGLERHDLVFYYGFAKLRSELANVVAALQPSAEFRSKWQYQNLMYGILGAVVEEVTGHTWERFVQERIFNELGMSRSHLSSIESRRDKNHALPYNKIGDERRIVPFPEIGALGPAGAIHSTVSDLVRWVQLHLSNGMVGDSRFVSKGLLSEMISPQMVMPAYPSSDTPMASYGLGWEIHAYRGHRLIQHGGGIDGFICNIGFLPDNEIGVVVLSNQTPDPVPYLVFRTIVDEMLHLEPMDWDPIFRAQKENMEEHFAQLSQIKVPQVPNAPMSQSIDAYCGSFRHEAYGDLTITVQGGRLQFQFNRFTCLMDHFHYDTFILPLQLMGISVRQLLTFKLGEDGQINGIRVRLEPDPSSPLLEFFRVS